MFQYYQRAMDAEAELRELRREVSNGIEPTHWFHWYVFAMQAKSQVI